MISRFLGALQFLTVLPISASTASPGRAAAFFPMVGALLGASAGAVVLFVPQPIGPLLAVVWLMTITGCLHEDGLADVADAIRAGRTREKIFAILKDSRIGTYGAVALVVSILLRWQALAVCRVNPLYGLIAAVAISRATMVVTAAISAHVGEGLGSQFVREVSAGSAIIAAVVATATAFATGWQYASALLIANALLVLAARAYFTRRLGGVNGDCLGATCQASEALSLLVLTWQY